MKIDRTYILTGSIEMRKKNSINRSIYLCVVKNHFDLPPPYTYYYDQIYYYVVAVCNYYGVWKKSFFFVRLHLIKKHYFAVNVKYILYNTLLSVALCVYAVFKFIITDSYSWEKWLIYYLCSACHVLHCFMINK